MEFLLLVLAIHFIAEMVIVKIKAGKANDKDDTNEKIHHPAETDLR